MEASSTSIASVTVYESTWHRILDNCGFFKMPVRTSKLLKCIKSVVFVVSKCKQIPWVVVSGH